MGQAKLRKQFIRNSGLSFTELLDDIGNTPCNGCTACCYHPKVDLSKDDDPTLYETETREDGSVCLKRTPEGACVHLGPTGCTIHDRRPRACRGYDCRMLSMIEGRTAFKPDKVTPAWQIHVKTWKDMVIKWAMLHGRSEILSKKPDAAGEEILKYAIENIGPAGDLIHGFFEKMANIPPAVLAELKSLPPTHKLSMLGPEKIEAQHLLRLIRGLQNLRKVNTN